jgi:hypothetical protein
MTLAKSSEATFWPSCNIKGRIFAAELPPNSRAEVNDGITRCVANSGGNEATASPKVLYKSYKMIKAAFSTYLKNNDLSASPATGNPSKLSHT